MKKKLFSTIRQAEEIAIKKIRANTFKWLQAAAEDGYTDEKNKEDLTRSAENILLTRESYFPASIADLYEPSAMPSDLRKAHKQNDVVVERIYIGREFKNDTERLEKLFDLYTNIVQGMDAINNQKNER